MLGSQDKELTIKNRYSDSKNEDDTQGDFVWDPATGMRRLLSPVILFLILIFYLKKLERP
jgi:hypothetical protein